MTNFTNIRNVRQFQNKGFICTLDVKGETMEFYAKPSGGGICDAVLAAIAANNYAGQITQYTPPEPTNDMKRRDALAAKWEDPFALLDDVLARGIAPVKAERDAIKAANPKS